MRGCCTTEIDLTGSHRLMRARAPSAKLAVLLGNRHMADYRAYVLDVDGHITERLDLDCADDAEAVRLARRRLKDPDIEVWQGARMVARFSNGAHPPDRGPLIPG